MRILTLPLYPHEFSSRVRVDFLIPSLIRRGFQVDSTPPIRRDQFDRWYGGGRSDRFRYHAAELTVRLQTFLRSAKYDLIWIQKGMALFPWRGLTTVLSLFNGTVVFDRDDSILTHPPIQTPRWAKWLSDEKQALRIHQKADLVLCANKTLMDESTSLGRLSKWLPSTIPLHRYPREDIQISRKPSVVWLGTSSNLRYLEPLRFVFDQVAKTFPDLRLHIVSDRPPDWREDELGRCEWEFTPWDPEREFDHIRKGWLGIMPLPDDPWTRGKSGYKLLQYMSAGLPVAASPVGVNRELVKESGAGFLVHTDEEWADAFRVLLGNAALRREMGAKGRKHVEERYGADLWGNRLADWFEELKGRPRPDWS